MSFFYDLNKKLDSIRATPEVTHKQLNERDMSRAAKGWEKYGPGMTELSRLGREGASEKKMDAARKKYDKYDNTDELNELSVNKLQNIKHGANALARDERMSGGNADMAAKAERVAGKAGNRAHDKTAADMKAQGMGEGWKGAAIGGALGSLAGPAGALAGAAAGHFVGNDMAKWGKDKKVAQTAQAQKPAQSARTGPVINDYRKNNQGADTAKVGEGAHSQDAMKLNPDFAKIGRKPGAMARVAQGAKKIADFVAPGDEELITRLRRSSPKAGEPNYMEAAKYRDPKYKDKLYTQEPLDHTFGPDMDAAYYNNYPDDYEGRKRPMGGDEFDHNDPLRKGFGRGGASNSINTRGPRKGMPSRDQITGLKGSIKAAQGTHAEPNLPEAGMPMTAKQKSFAALAPPANKITFADKIAGAKKEVDEMLGDVAAEAMKSALGKGKQPVRGMGEATKEIPGGRVHTAEPGGYGRKDDEDDEGKKVVANTQRGRGRPKNNASADTGEVMKPDWSAFGGPVKLKPHTGKITKHKMVGEADPDPEDQGEYDQEGDMAKDTIKTVVRHAQALEKILGDNDNLPEWVQSKLAKIEGMMTAVDDYMQNQADDNMDMDDDQEPIAEKAVSKKQQRFMGMVSAAKKGEKPASKEVAKVAKTMKKGDAEDFASTKHKGLPEKAAKKNKEEDVEESTTSGSVATSTAAPKAAKGAGGFTFGKGIYDSMNREVENMIAESMSINMSMNNDDHGGPTRSLTITATDDDATKLAQLLKSAGLGGSDHGYHTMDENYGVNEVSQNTPDYPTNTETAQDNFEYSGGLNKPKTDVAGNGQTTVPNTAVHTQDEDALRRMMEMSGIREAKPDMAEAINKGASFKRFETDPRGNEKLPAKELDDKKVKVQEADTEFAESIRRMREIAGLDKKAVDEEKTEEGNKFAHNVLKAKEAGKTQADLDGDGDMEKVRESIFTLTNQWRAYKG